jgi:hypothetical protein
MINISINTKVVNKTDENFVYNNRFRNVQITAKELLDTILEGHAFCVASLKSNEDGYCHKKTENFVSGHLICIDIDNKNAEDKKLSIDEGYLSFEEAKQSKELQTTASFVYTTPSHTSDHNRFRIIFVLKNSITDIDKFKKLIKHMIKKYSGDEVPKSVVQGFYGSTNAEHVFWGNVLDDNDVRELLKEAEVVSSKEYKRLNEMSFVDTDVSIDTIDEIVSYIFKNGHIDNSIWWKVPTILKAYCKLPDEEVIRIVGKYVDDVGDIREKLKYAEQYLHSMTLGTLIYYAQQNGYEMSAELIGNNKKIGFWKIIYDDKAKNDDSKFNVHISFTLFNRFLYNNGFRIYEQERGVQLVRINESNQIDEITENHMREFVFDFLNRNKDLYSNIKEKFMVEEKVRKSSSTLFSTTIKNMKSINAELEKHLIKDTKDYVYFFYKNGFRIISKDSDEFKSYKKLKGLIWKNAIINRDYKKSDGKKSEHQRFIECVCTREVDNKQEFQKDKYEALKSANGYLLNRHKKRTETKAIVLIDEDISDVAEGGTGKSIFNEAIGKMRNMALIDGRNLKLDNQFHFSDITLSTEVINIDDCARSFNFEKLYHSITGDITVERKGKDKFTIPFDKAPKFCLSTNHIFKGNGNSHNRRLVEIEFSSYFNANHTPEDEFGHQLFNDWDAKEWNRFDDFMCQSVQFYLNNGLVSYKQENTEYKKLIENTSQELAEYFVNYIFPEKIYCMDRTLNEYNDIQRDNITQTKLTQKINYYAEKYLSMTIHSEYNRKLKTKIFVITEDKKKTLKYWKNTDQYKILTQEVLANFSSEGIGEDQEIKEYIES